MDYYAVLGVAKGSSADEIKKSYRKLALEHHPDRNPDAPDAEDKLKKINEAYAVLSDVQKRASYDRFGIRDQRRKQPPPGDMAEAFRNMGFDFNFGGRQGGPQRGGDISIQYPISIASAILGDKEHIEVSINDTCPKCVGTGAEKFDTCADCDGKGMVSFVHNNMRMANACRSCGGMGKFILDACKRCNGVKTVQSTRSFDVTFPPGIHHGQRMALRGQGQGGVGGGPPGDAYITVDILYPVGLTKEEEKLLRSLDAKTK